MSDIYQKYQKVKTLAEQGATEGEKEAAREAMRRIEEAHPELVTPKKDESHIRARPSIFYQQVIYRPSGNSTGATAGSSSYVAFYYVIHR